jgi:hypothetical protein
MGLRPFIRMVMIARPPKIADYYFVSAINKPGFQACFFTLSNRRKAMNHSVNPTSSKRLIAIATSLIVIFSLVLAPSPKNTHLTSFIIQGKNVDEVERIVESYGGDITSRLEIISGVAANLSPGIAPRLLTESGITSIKANSIVNLAKKSSWSRSSMGARHTWNRHLGSDIRHRFKSGTQHLQRNRQPST